MKRACVVLVASIVACSRPNYGGPPPTALDDAGARAMPMPPPTVPPPVASSSGSAPTPAPSSLPPVLSGWNGAGCAAKGSGKQYDVGDGKPLASLGAVPWAKLQPGDTVRIFARKAPYREKVLVSESGTESQPIRICGVPSATGELPVIDGDGATTDKSLEFSGLAIQQRGAVIVTTRDSHPTGYKPKYVVLEGLEVRNAYETFKFTDSRGRSESYRDNAAAIYIERGEHIVVRGCTIHDSGNGLFVASNDSEATQSRDILVDANYIFGNGTLGKRFDRHHNVYTEAIGITFQGNRIGKLRDGSGGNGIKDRSAGTVVRYNWIDGGAHLLDLVEPEESIKTARTDPRLHATYVYGNVFIAGRTTARPIHYGGDNGNAADYRKGTLFFYANTLVLTADEKETWNTSIFQLETQDETADIRNNVFMSTGSTHVTWAFEKGTMRLGVNFAPSGFKKGRDEFIGKFEYVSGADKTINGDDPKLIDLAHENLCLAAGSSARGVAADLPPLPADLWPKAQYKPHQATIPREKFGSGGDLGALVCP